MTCWESTTSIYKFLSTFPRRERLEHSDYRPLRKHFYPRSHVGNDENIRFPIRSLHTFLSTFPRRERPHGECSGCHRKYFYPRSHVGNDTFDMDFNETLRDFYPRSHVGNDLCSFLFVSLLSTFLSTFPRRERQLFIVINKTVRIISIHVPT